MATALSLCRVTILAEHVSITDLIIRHEQYLYTVSWTAHIGPQVKLWGS